MEKLGVGIIGCGGIGRAHASLYRERPDAEIRALCDISPRGIQALGEELGVEARYDDYQELLARDDIDVVSICTPHALHEEQLIAAVGRGKHVCLEKPVAISPEQSARMLGAATAAGVIVTLGLPLRYYPCNARIRELLREGHAGERVVTKQTFGTNFVAVFGGLTGGAAWWFDRSLSGGGVLITQTVHYLDLIRWLHAEPVESVLADVWQAPVGVREGFDTNVVLTMLHEDGARTLIENNWATDGHPSSLEVYGTAGSIVGAGPSPADLSITVTTRDPETGPRTVLSEHVGPGERTPGHDRIIGGLLESVRAGRLVGDLPTLEHGHELQRIIEAGYRSAREGRRVRMAEIP